MARQKKAEPLTAKSPEFESLQRLADSVNADLIDAEDRLDEVDDRLDEYADAFDHNAEILQETANTVNQHAKTGNELVERLSKLSMLAEAHGVLIKGLRDDLKVLRREYADKINAQGDALDALSRRQDASASLRSRLAERVAGIERQVDSLELTVYMPSPPTRWQRLQLWWAERFGVAP